MAFFPVRMAAIFSYRTCCLRITAFLHMDLRRSPLLFHKINVKSSLRSLFLHSLWKCLKCWIAQNPLSRSNSKVNLPVLLPDIIIRKNQIVLICRNTPCIQGFLVR